MISIIYSNLYNVLRSNYNFLINIKIYNRYLLNFNLNGIVVLHLINPYLDCSPHFLTMATFHNLSCTMGLYAHHHLDINIPRRRWN